VRRDDRDARSVLADASTHGAGTFVVPPANGFGGSVKRVGIAAMELLVLRLGLFGFMAREGARGVGLRAMMVPPPGVGRPAQEECTKEAEK